jgi:hypothetical protein
VSFPERGTTQEPSQPNLDLFGSEFSEKIYYMRSFFLNMPNLHNLYKFHRKTRNICYNVPAVKTCAHFDLKESSNRQLKKYLFLAITAAICTVRHNL